ncbi:aflatoxin B1 aldehyde reductase member 3 [Aspergillus lentulus]|uniref:Aflatoxin B1 aldehyde reductase member 3 n=1 Tax=Aspergillus lentulus TaxID=293939 RepID=A0AAN4T6T2_ASPLE|nr:aflatoxin B1 aldehyde reductase member 3 [Aspergillus lentulus]
MAYSPKADLKIVFGAMTFGKPGQPLARHLIDLPGLLTDGHLGTLGARVHSTDDAGQMLDIFQDHGHREIDTARLNAPVIYSHRPEDVRRGLINSLRALDTDKFDLFYLHGPDRKTPFEDTLREVNALYEEVLFNRFGVSNYMSWEVAQMCEICAKHGWIKPSVYQGIYSALQRSIEPELIPCLRYYGISLYAFQPLAGGFLTGRYHRNQTEFESGSRFDPKGVQGSLRHARYWNDAYFDALDRIRSAAEKHGLSVGEVAMRWLKHHSQLAAALGDSIIIGASSASHLTQNLKDLECGPLAEDVVTAVEEAWLCVKGVAPKYWH